MNASCNIVNSVIPKQKNRNRRVKAVGIVIELANEGITLKTDDDRNLMYYPKSQLTANQREQTQLYKKEIIDYLNSLSWSDDWDKTNEKTISIWCLAYDHSRGWRSIYGDHLICGTCYSPVSEKVVAEWIQRE
jgi:hypothetical protein